MSDSTPASPFDSEFESWLHTAMLGGAPMRGTNLPPSILQSLQELASNTSPTPDDQQALRDAWAQSKRDEAAKELAAREAAAQVEANTTATPADPQPAPGQENTDDAAPLEPDTTITDMSQPQTATTTPDTTTQTVG